MTQQTRSTNTGRFENGDTTSGSNFQDVFDSFLSLADTTAQTVTSDIQAPRLIATTEVSALQVNTTEVSASTGNFSGKLTAVQVSASSMVANIIDANTVSAGTLQTGKVSAAAGSANMFGRYLVGPSAAAMGDKVLCQSVSVPSNNTKLSMTRLPNGACIINMAMFVQTPPSASAGSTTNVLVGTSTQDARFGTFTNVTAQGFYTTPTSTRTSAWMNVSGADQTLVVVHTTAASGAIASAATGRVTITYYMRQGS